MVLLVPVSTDTGTALVLSCDPGWFMVDDLCINFYHCPDCMNNSKAQEQCLICGGQLAYHLFKNVTTSTPGNKLDHNTKLSLLWNMFHNVGDISPSTGYFVKGKRDTLQIYQSILL